MSVLTDIYPARLKPLEIERLLPAIQKAIPTVAIRELKLSKRSVPDWRWLVLSHLSVPGASFCFAVASNGQDGISEVEAQFPGQKLLSGVRRARLLIWSQLRLGGIPERLWGPACDLEGDLIWQVAKISGAVIHQPECERLFTATSWRRYELMHRKKYAEWRAAHSKKKS